ncbi:MAG TPA: glycosyltransferase family 4 protein [Polyangiaceae bacterium]|nr:glycosyltransferase family 4 protein [Polyangiaceae bacterium]
MRRPRVLFVSKPVVPPFHDGTKCLVRDVATHLMRFDGSVLGTRGGPELAPGRVTTLPVYGDAGAFAPALAENARAALYVLLRARADVFHFVFSPNPKTSAVGAAVRKVRRVPVVQTIASPPRAFVPGQYFGDVLVAQSEWTADRVRRAHRDARAELPRLAVIPPPIAGKPTRSPEQIERTRRALDLPEDGVVFTYPGDLEVSRGADTVAAALPGILAGVPGAVVVFACRWKTPEARGREEALARRLPPASVRFAREVDLPALLHLSTAVLFPVDDLHGKVDLPISLLEAMRLRVPVVTLREGPLAELEGVVTVPGSDARALSDAAVRLALDPIHRETVVAAGAATVDARHDAALVASRYEDLYESLLRR